jgi:hypothetical protein
MAGEVGASTGRASSNTPPIFSSVDRLVGRIRQLWRHDLIRLVGLTIYYLSIIAGLVILYGGAEYVPPPFVYQGF